ncbi:hypothetical protein C2855_15295 [Aeromonas bestiarum]|nr:hypothetical protein C2855_15295 [Aeromonas bestiarum]
MLSLDMMSPLSHGDIFLTMRKLFVLIKQQKTLLVTTLGLSLKTVSIKVIGTIQMEMVAISVF